MALTPLPSSIGRGSNAQPSDHELSALPLDQSFCMEHKVIVSALKFDARWFTKFPVFVEG